MRQEFVAERIAFEFKIVYNLSLHVQTIDKLFSYMIRAQSLGREDNGSKAVFLCPNYYMQISALIGRKIDQTQGFLEDGTRVPLSIISVGSNTVLQIKTTEHEGYNAVQLGFGSSKKTNKPMTGHIKKAGTEKTPRFFREIRVDDSPDFSPGSAISPQEVFEAGDIVDVTGTSKGKGFAGVVKRHGFHGGPRTHGQSDRERAPGSIGQTTTPGRVYRGKRMAGRMGNERVTIKNLEVLDVLEDKILVRGLIPGSKGSIVIVHKVGKSKKFVPLWSDASAASDAASGELKEENAS